jgi:hypothetical protein
MWTHSLMRSQRTSLWLVFKIEVFRALRMRFGPSKYTPLKTTLRNATSNLKWGRHLKSSIKYARHKNQQAKGSVTPRSRVRRLIRDSSHCIGLYWKYVPYDSCTSLIWVLYFISKFLDWCLGWGPQSWTLLVPIAIQVVLAPSNRRNCFS